MKNKQFAQFSFSSTIKLLRFVKFYLIFIHFQIISKFVIESEFIVGQFFICLFVRFDKETFIVCDGFLMEFGKKAEEENIPAV